jgi:ketosteroid isomerase-like protein
VTQTNRDRVARALQDWQDGTAPITDLLADHVVWRIEGRSAVAGGYASLRHFIDEVLAPFGQRFVGGERFRPVRVRSILADDDTVVVVWEGRGVASDGGPYENSYAWILRMADGQVVDGTAFFDSVAFDELWTRVTL